MNTQEMQTLIKTQEIQILMTILILVLISLFIMIKTNMSYKTDDSKHNKTPNSNVITGKNASIPEMLRYLSLIQNGVDVKKYKMSEFINTLPEYNVLISNYLYIDHYEQQLNYLLTEIPDIAPYIEATQTTAKIINDSFMQLMDEWQIMHDIRAIIRLTTAICDAIGSYNLCNHGKMVK